MLRGLVFAGAMVVVRLVQGALINAFQTQAGLISMVLLLLFIIGVVVWGVLDGRADARANPDPDRRQDLAMTWLLAGLVAGILSGAVAWLLALFYKGLYTGGLINEVTTFAAFTALLVFLPAIIGVTVGRWRVDRNPDAHRARRSRRGTGRHRRVRRRPRRRRRRPARSPPAPAGPSTRNRLRRWQPPKRGEPSERDAPTETIPTTDSTYRNDPDGDDDAKTEVIRTDTEAGHSGSEPEKG